MRNTPKSLRLQIALVGRTNVGKSSFLNLVAGQDVAITSPVPGTTTDVVEKPIELLPVGPVLFLDTGGVDDATVLAEKRAARTRLAMERADVVVLVVEPNVWTEHESALAAEAARLEAPLIVVVNKTDLGEPSGAFLDQVGKVAQAVIRSNSQDRSKRDATVSSFKEALLKLCPEDFVRPPPLLGDLILPRGSVVLVVPIDMEAPKGRLILPQVQALRDVLDHDGAAHVVKEHQYADLLADLKTKPDLVVCDSQVVRRVVSETPPHVRCTTFSILFSRSKGDLVEQARHTAAIRNLRSGDRVLIAEACSHHPLEDDIGRRKIPRWLRERTGLDLRIESCAGRDYPEDLQPYALVIHCGACMLTRREMLRRLERAAACGVPVTNYGLCISYLHGVLERVLEPFPEAQNAFREALQRAKAEVRCDVVGAK
jgi:[FeFe] hydrogenase H-cluster maturation GTPase HydF